MNYPLLTILITKIYMIYNSNFIYTWQLSDQVVVPIAWRQLTRHIQSGIDTGRIPDAPYATSQAGCSQCTTYAHLRGHQTSKHWGGDSIIGICDKNGMRDVCRV